MQSLALSTASSSASAAAAAAASGCPAGSSSAARAASQARAAARSARQAMVAHRCLTAWNEPIGRPNCLRVLAYSAAVPLHQAATPAASATYRVAARSRTPSVLRPGRRFSGGTTASSSRTAASSREKSSGVRWSTVTPGWPASSRNHASPSGWRRGRAGDRRTRGGGRSRRSPAACRPPGGSRSACRGRTRRRRWPAPARAPGGASPGRSGRAGGWPARWAAPGRGPGRRPAARARRPGRSPCRRPGGWPGRRGLRARGGFRGVPGPGRGRWGWCAWPSRGGTPAGTAAPASSRSARISSRSYSQN